MAKVLSDTPGRIRLRLEGRSERAAAGRLEQLPSQLPVRSVQVSRGISSVTIYYDEHRLDRSRLLEVLAVDGVSIAPAAPYTDPIASYTGVSPVSTAVIDNLQAANRATVRFSSGSADLKLLIPLGLAVFGGLRGLFRGFGQIPGYLFLWYAFDTFFKLHSLNNRPDAGREASEAQAADRHSRSAS
jgi:hypothetical protein